MYKRQHHILTEELGMKKLSTRWMPRLLTSDQKRMRIQTSQECSDSFKKNPKDFIRRFVTTDETWVHYFTLETKQQSNQWKHSDSRSPKTVKSILSGGKCMACLLYTSNVVTRRNM